MGRWDFQYSKGRQYASLNRISRSGSPLTSLEIELFSSPARRRAQIAISAGSLMAIFFGAKSL